jgi:hypothetical protein
MVVVVEREVVLAVDGARPKAGGGRAGAGQGKARSRSMSCRAAINIGCVTWRRERAQARALQAAQSTAGKTTRQMQHARCNTQDARRTAHGRQRVRRWAGRAEVLVLKLAWGGICREHDGAQTALDRRRRPWQSSATSSRGALYMSSTPSPTNTPKPSLPPLLPS